jgi:hypothetical protein
MLRHILIIFCISLINYPALAQEADPYLENFLAVQQDDDVFLRWTIKAGFTCDGTRIQWSEDGVSFEKVGEIPGVCGSPNQSVTYDFTDTVPQYNRMNYYRLDMGILGFSSNVFVEVIRLNEEGYSLNPNPVVDISTLLFNNPDNESHEVCLVNMNGELVYNEITNSNKVEIDRALLSSGTYIFKILKGNELKVRGKLIVL